MTFCLAIKYQDGVLVMADTELSMPNFSMKVKNVNKIYEFGNNVLLASAGDYDQGQQIESLLTETYNETLFILETFIQKKLKLKNNSKKDFVLEEKLNLLEGQEFVIKKKEQEDVELFLKEPRRGYIRNTLETYINRNRLYFDVGSCGEFIRSIKRNLNLTTSEFLIVGLDNKGAYISSLEIDNSLFREPHYYVIGNSWQTSRALLDSLYKNGLTEKEAILLATYVGICSEKRFMGINDKFTAFTLSKKRGVIEKRVVSEEEFEHYKKITSELILNFPYELAK